MCSSEAGAARQAEAGLRRGDEGDRRFGEEASSAAQHRPRRGRGRVPNQLRKHRQGQFSPDRGPRLRGHHRPDVHAARRQGSGQYPLGGIAPSGARAIVKTEIVESERAFLREGLPVKLKFSAFPYQRYGVINGTLEYVAPATKPSPQSKQPVYEARVSLERDYYQVAEAKYPLRFGMTAAVEIVVRDRRLIDLALDPFRQVGG